MTLALDHAVVIGGSLAGLAAARVLADRAARVTVVDSATVSLGTRAGVPQEHHPHVLLQSGTTELEKLFPGLIDEISRDGAQAFDWGEMTTQFPDARADPFPTGVMLHPIARSALEALVRQRVAARHNVTLISRFRADGLLWSQDRRTVTGITGRRSAAGIEQIEADLVVDASGRHTKLPDWLSAAIGEPVPTRTVGVPLCYGSTIYRSAPGGPGFAAFYEPIYAPMTRRGALVLPVAEDRWIVGLVGVNEVVPNADSGYLTFAKSLRSPLVADFIRSATRAAPHIHRFVQPGSRWFGYHRMRSWPARLMALGDAVCTTNPVYGQGISLAVQQASALRRLLDAYEPAQLAARFQREVAGLLRYPWLIAYNADRGWSQRGSAPVADLVRWYMKQLLDHAVHDRDTFCRLMAVQQLVASPARLVSPATVLGVAACALRDVLHRRPAGFAAEGGGREP